MRNKNLTFVLLIFTVGLTGCSSKSPPQSENQKSKAHHIYLPSKGQNLLKLSFFADTVYYVPLETTEESILNGIGKVWMNDSLILVWSYKSEIMSFKTDGTFLRKIGTLGKGPGEYENPFTFAVVNDTLCIPNNRNGIVRYTLDGIYCDEFMLHQNTTYSSALNNKQLVYYNQNEGELLIYNRNFRVANTIKVEYGITQGRYLTIQMDFGQKPHLYNTSAGLLFNSHRNDTIWRIENTTKTPAFIFDTKEKMLPYDKQIEFFPDNLDEWSEVIKPYSYFHILTFPSINFILQRPWATYFANYQAFYVENTQTGETTRFNTSFIHDDIASKLKLLENPRIIIHTTNSKKYMVTSISPLEALDKLEQESKDSINKPSASWINQMKKIKEGDNPILILMKIK